ALEFLPRTCCGNPIKPRLYRWSRYSQLQYSPDLHVVPRSGIADALPLRNFVRARHLLEDALQAASAFLAFFYEPYCGTDAHIHAYHFTCNRNRSMLEREGQFYL